MITPLSPARRTAALTVFVLALSVACTSVGPTHLAIESPRRIDPDTVEVMVECAERVEATVEPGAGVHGLPLVTITGEPRTGRCRVPVRLDLPAAVTAVEDSTTGMVVDLIEAGT